MKPPFSILLLAAGLAFLWGASRLHESLLEWRMKHGPAEVLSLDNSPPLVVFTTVAMGGFRGIIADLLWMRAVRLQEEEKVFEMAQLADWITKLEPHFTTVWAFHAWNMAYNISILFPDPEDRWRWVSHGIQLLRDEGLKYNPRSPDLCRELGWLYQHKIGFIMDQAHTVYKWKLAEEMGQLFDGPCPDYRAVDSPSQSAPRSAVALRGGELAEQGRDPRWRRLREEYKLDPEMMETIDRTYGPLDWRLPASHGFYWAYRGRQVSAGGRSTRSCEQMMFQCMAESFRHGRLFIDPQTRLYLVTPNLELLPNAVKAYEEAMQRYNEVSFHWAYANFLGEAVLILFSYNRIQQAEELYQRLARKYPGPDADLGFEAFIDRNMKRTVEDTPFRDAMALIEGFLFQHYFWMAMGDEERAAGCERFAQGLWKHYMDTRVNEAHRQRTGLPPIAQIRQLAYRRAVREITNTHLVARLKALAPEETTGVLTNLNDLPRSHQDTKTDKQ